MRITASDILFEYTEPDGICYSYSSHRDPNAKPMTYSTDHEAMRRCEDVEHMGKEVTHTEYLQGIIEDLLERVKALEEK